MNIRKIDHVGVVVHNLSAAKAFFLNLGLDVVIKDWELEGEEAVDRVIGLDNVKNKAVMLGVPGGQANIELIQFLTPPEKGTIGHLPANTLGIRHIAFVVEDIEAVVAKLKDKGTETFSEIQDFGGYKLCYVHGPEGIILELAEQVT